MAPGAPPLVLASGSATRRTLLHAAGLAFTTHTPAVDEAAIKHTLRARGADAPTAALALADAKAATVPDPAALVIGADQILVCDGTWFDKPPDLPTARTHLRHLRGRQHTLATAITCWQSGRRRWHHLAHPVLTMRPFTDTFLDTYLAAEGEAVLSSVGCYRLEGLGAQLFEMVEGEHAAVLGLPLLALLAFLRGEGVFVT